MYVMRTHQLEVFIKPFKVGSKLCPLHPFDIQVGYEWDDFVTVDNDNDNTHSLTKSFILVDNLKIIRRYTQSHSRVNQEYPVSQTFILQK